jgi:predicted MPP superfamily phosphohydrolase
MASKKLKAFVIFLLIMAVLSAVIIYENKNIELNTYEIVSDKLPETFDGYRIAHISDLHNAEFGEDNSKLISMIKEAEPDIIVITGDIIDSRKTDIDIASAFVEEALKIAPCCYVSGNHEARVADYSLLKEKMTESGVIVLDNQKLTINQADAFVEIAGISDPNFSCDYLMNDEAEIIDSQLKEIEANDDIFTVLLSHRPEFFEIYSQFNVDLVLSGHAHGGQFRLPVLGGLIAPGQGLFPEYDSGLYQRNGTNMIVSRGIGNSIIPLRINNRPEVILIELHNA